MSDSDNNVDDDYSFSRSTYYSLIMKGQEALDTMSEVAQETGHPRAFEVLGNMIKQISDVNDKLMDLNKKRKEMKTKSQLPATTTGVTNNNLFVGSTTDLQRLLRDQLESPSNIVDISDYQKDDK